MWARSVRLRSFNQAVNLLGLRRNCPCSRRTLASGGNTRELQEDQLNSAEVHSEKQQKQPISYSEFVEPRPITSLNIRAKIEKMEKPGSVFSRYYMGSFDSDLLDFPFLLKTRQEFLTMNDQYEMVRATWSKIAKTDETLDLLGYNSLYNLSVSEMLFIFEAIGASIQKQFTSFGTREDVEIRAEKKMAKSFQGFSSSSSNHLNIPEAAFQSFSNARSALETLLPLLVRNSLVYYAISRSSNPTIRELYLTRNQDQQTSTRKPKIALALSEPSDGGQSSYFRSWTTEACLTYDNQSWVVSGEKSKIPKCSDGEGGYTHYLVFARTGTFDEPQPFKPSSSNSPSKDEGVVGLLVPADQVEVLTSEVDYFGLPYTSIRFRDIKLPRQETEVVKGGTDLSAFLNVKGAGQLATGAVILGLLKQLLRNTYAHLVNEKAGLAGSDLLQYRLYQATSKIYGLESMLYMSAAMYDCFEVDGAGGTGGPTSANMECEAATVKTAAAEAGFQVCESLRSIFGSRHPFASTASDLIYALDAHLDTSLHNRLLLGRRAVEVYTGSSGAYGNKKRFNFTPKAPVYSVVNYLRHRKLQAGSDFLNREMTKFAHHNLHSACEWIESCLNRLEFSNSFLVNVYGEKAMLSSKDVELDRLATLSMDIFKMISVLSRANHALCYGIRNGDAEKELCLAICKDTFIRHLALFEEVTKETMVDNDAFAEHIAAQNRAEGGYFASLFRV